MWRGSREVSISRVLPDRYPAGRLLDLGVIAPRIGDLYEWSAGELKLPALADLVRAARRA